MKKALLISSLLFGVATSAFAVTSNSVEIDIKELEYNRPNRGIGFAGDLKFTKVNMFRDGMVLALDNKDSHFDSQIFVRPTFIGIKSPVLQLGFSLENEILASIERATLDKSRVVINDRYFIFSADEFNYKDDSTTLTLNDFRFFCSSHESYQAGSIEGIIAGCLTDSNVNAKKEGGTSSATVVYKSGPDETSKGMKLEGNVKSMEVSSNNIKAKLEKAKIEVDGYKISSKEVAVSCAKDPDKLELDTEKLEKDCLSEISIGIPELHVVDSKEGTEFDLSIQKLDIKNEEIDFESRWTAMSDEKSRTHLLNLDLDCGLAEDIEVFDLQSVIGECLTKGSIDVSHIITEEIKRGTPTVRLNSKDATVTGLKLRMKGHKLVLDAKVFALFKLMTIHMEADVAHDKRAGLLELNLTKVKLPLGIRSPKMMLKLIKKYMVSETVKVSNNRIYIQF
jgi:hypothetical protein